MQETLLPGKMRKMRGHARDQDEEETRKEMQQAQKVPRRGERQGCAASVTPSPPPGGINLDSCPLPWEDSVASEVPAPFLTRVGHPNTWVPCSRYREEREKSRAGE